MRYGKICTGVVAAALLLTACGSDDGGDSDQGADATAEGDQGAAEQEELPVAVTEADPDVYASATDADPGPRPDSSGGFTAQVEHRLQESVLRMARVDGETSAECPDGVTQEAGATSACTATYAGVEIPFEVTINDDYQEGDFVTQYRSVPESGLLAGTAVYTEFLRWVENRGEGERLACDEIPDAEAVELNADSGYQCQFWTEYGGPDRTGGYTFVQVRATDMGPEFEPVPN